MLQVYSKAHQKLPRLVLFECWFAHAIPNANCCRVICSKQMGRDSQGGNKQPLCLMQKVFSLALLLVCCNPKERLGFRRLIVISKLLSFNSVSFVCLSQEHFSKASLGGDGSFAIFPEEFFF